MRKRLTAKRFSDGTTKNSSLRKHADPYTLGQDRKDPGSEKYMIGDSYDFGEEPDMDTPWKNENRDSVTHMPVASRRVMFAKAEIGLKLAELMLPNAPERVVDQQAMELMDLPMSSLKSTLRRLSSLNKEAELPVDGAPAPVDAAPAPAPEAPAVEMGGGDDAAPEMDLPADETEEADDELMTPEEKAGDVLEQVETVLEEVQDVLEEIAFDGMDMGEEADADDKLVLSSQGKNKEVKTASKRGAKKLNNISKGATGNSSDTLLSNLWKSAPDVSDLF